VYTQAIENPHEVETTVLLQGDRLLNEAETPLVGGLRSSTWSNVLTSLIVAFGTPPTKLLTIVDLLHIGILAPHDQLALFAGATGTTAHDILVIPVLIEVRSKHDVSPVS
jgi:hypothetical protein